MRTVLRSPISFSLVTVVDEHDGSRSITVARWSGPAHRAAYRGSANAANDCAHRSAYDGSADRARHCACGRAAFFSQRNARYARHQNSRYQKRFHGPLLSAFRKGQRRSVAHTFPARLNALFEPDRQNRAGSLPP